MTQLLTSTERLAVAVFGAANVDILADTARALAPGDSTPGRITMTAGGVARNVAENLARLGCASHLISAVGDDLQGHFVLDHTRRAGVDVSSCSVWPSQRTGSYLSLNNPDGSLLAAINDMTVLNLLDARELAGCAASVAKASAWVVDCNLSGAAIEWIMHNSAGKPVFVDGVSGHKCMAVLPFLAQINTLKINRLEASALTGLPVGSATEAIAAAQSLHARGVQNVVVSLSAGGVCWCAPGGHGHAAAITIDAISSNGAGDAMTAALVYSALAAWPIAQSVRFANACAALTMLSASANHPGLSASSALGLMGGHAAGLIRT